MDMIKLLINNCNNLHLSDNHGQTPLMYASFQGHETIVRYFLGKSCAYLNSQDSHRQTALMYASYQGHGGIVKSLLQNDANPHLTDKYQKTALYYTKYPHIRETIRKEIDIRRRTRSLFTITG